MAATPLHAAVHVCRPTHAKRHAQACINIRGVLMRARAGTFLGVPDVPLLGLGLAALGRPGYINLGHGSDLSKGGSAPHCAALPWLVRTMHVQARPQQAHTAGRRTQR